jgi:hypothetical protein
MGIFIVGDVVGNNNINLGTTSMKHRKLSKNKIGDTTMGTLMKPMTNKN